MSMISRPVDSACRTARSISAISSLANSWIQSVRAAISGPYHACGLSNTGSVESTSADFIVISFIACLLQSRSGLWSGMEPKAGLALHRGQQVDFPGQVIALGLQRVHERRVRALPHVVRRVEGRFESGCHWSLRLAPCGGAPLERLHLSSEEPGGLGGGQPREFSIRRRNDEHLACRKLRQVLRKTRAHHEVGAGNVRLAKLHARRE